jgi:1,4-dihydroxy-2-naphthoate octaprenyltransferase
LISENDFPFRYKRHESETMDLVWLVALVLGSGFAIAGVQTSRRKLLNLIVILVCMCVGFGIGYAFGLGSKNMGRVPDAGLPFSMVGGILGAFGCMQLNKAHSK